VSEIRRYERIEIELPCRLYIPGGQGGLRFEAFCVSHNLGLGGTFLATSFLLRRGLELYVELGLPNGPLAIRSRVAHTVAIDDPTFTTGIGIEFLDVDAHGRETLLRYFSPHRYHEFYRGFVQEFPHLQASVPLRDISLVLNLWEEWKIRQAGGPSSTDPDAPDAPARAARGGRAPAPRPQREPAPKPLRGRRS
jgi:hypothetical protein